MGLPHLHALCACSHAQIPRRKLPFTINALIIHFQPITMRIQETPTSSSTLRHSKPCFNWVGPERPTEDRESDPSSEVSDSLLFPFSPTPHSTPRSFREMSRSPHRPCAVYITMKSEGDRRSGLPILYRTSKPLVRVYITPEASHDEQVQ